MSGNFQSNTAGRERYNPTPKVDLYDRIVDVMKECNIDDWRQACILVARGGNWSPVDIIAKYQHQFTNRR